LQRMQRKMNKQLKQTEKADKSLARDKDKWQRLRVGFGFDQ
jgi:hypothetical protein